MIEVSGKKLVTASWMFVVMALVMAIQGVVDGLPIAVGFLVLVAALVLSFRVGFPVKDVG